MAGDYFINAVFVRLLLSRVLSSFGSTLAFTALAVHIYQRTSSGKVVGAVELVTALPLLAFGLFAGAVADRHDRKRVMIGADLVRTMAWLGIALDAGLVALFPLLALSSAAGAFFSPAMTASLPRIVGDRHLLRANSITATAMQVVTVAAPAAGGIGVALFGFGAVSVINAVTFLISALIIWTLPIPPASSREDLRTAQPAGSREAPAVGSTVDIGRAGDRDGSGAMPVPPDPGQEVWNGGSGYWSSLRDGMRWVFRQRGLCAVLAGLMPMMLGGGAVVTLLVAFATDILRISASGYGTAITFVAAGSIAGAFLPSMLDGRVGRTRFLQCVMILLALAMAGIAISRALLPFALSLVAVGSLQTALGVVLGTWMMSAIPNQMLGRAASAFSLVFEAARILGLVLGAWLVDLVGVVHVYNGAAVLGIFGALLGTFGLRCRGPIAGVPRRHTSGPCLPDAVVSGE